MMGGWYFDFPDWTPDAKYYEGDLRTYEGKKYVCRESHPKSTGFDSEKWALWETYSNRELSEKLDRIIELLERE